MKTLQSDDGVEEIRIICQNFQTGLELLDFFPLKNVVNVAFINCILTHIPVFPNIKSLCLNSCTVADYDNISKCPSIELLNLCNNDLSELPLAVKNLTNLSYLDMSYNKRVAALPIWILELPLRFLSVNSNSIMELPELLPKTLQVLDAHNNSIQRLSPLLAKLPDLSYMNLHSNPLVFPEASIIKSKTKAVLQYLNAFFN